MSQFCAPPLCHTPAKQRNKWKFVRNLPTNSKENLSTSLPFYLAISLALSLSLSLFIAFCLPCKIYRANTIVSPDDGRSSAPSNNCHRSEANRRVGISLHSSQTPDQPVAPNNHNRWLSGRQKSHQSVHCVAVVCKINVLNFSTNCCVSAFIHSTAD